MDSGDVTDLFRNLKYPPHSYIYGHLKIETASYIIGIAHVCFFRALTFAGPEEAVRTTWPEPQRPGAFLLLYGELVGPIQYQQTGRESM